MNNKPQPHERMLLTLASCGRQILRVGENLNGIGNHISAFLLKFFAIVDLQKEFQSEKRALHLGGGRDLELIELGCALANLHRLVAVQNIVHDFLGAITHHDGLHIEVLVVKLLPFQRDFGMRLEDPLVDCLFGRLPAH